MAIRLAVVLMSAACALGACGTAAQNLAQQYSPQDTAWSRKPGDNTLTVTAKYRELSSKGGTTMELLPVARYTSDLVHYAYGNTYGGVETRDIAPRVNADFRKQDVRVEYCNVSGVCTFSKLPDGDYFVIASLTWKGLIGENRNRHVMKRVAVKDGATSVVVGD